MNYDEITKITAERISDYMTEAVNTDSIAVAEMFHNAAWGVRTLWFELVTKIDIDIHKKNRYASYDLRRKIEMQHEEFQKMTEREQVPLLKSPEWRDNSGFGVRNRTILNIYARECTEVSQMVIGR
ncbi:TPA: hypothetical protein J8109_004735 [Escherichia coli]|nr:hypothetical protein [Escherichia coli O11:H15]EFA7472696.1 hypothetical protein [Escherichia coli]ELC27010.1 hypothetical protein WCY_03438 [Escherichia coli KTE16]EFA7675095.1 hypothetical protein [Escherichia coli]EFA7703983.1 hypothetical protein [Escherichia coli]